MGLKYWLCAVLTLLLIQCWCCGSCLEQERTALLQLKIFFNGQTLRNWGRGDHNSNCCQWERVECNPSTGRVIALYLNYTRAYSSPYRYLNTSLFLPFEELKGLYLPLNGIAGCIQNEGFNRLSRKLRNLEILDLSRGIVSTRGLSKLINLKELDMSWNDIESLESSQEEEQSLRFVQLEVLDLSGNLFNNNILSFVNKFTNLKSLYIAYNKIKGLIDVTKFDALSNLEQLDMSNNMLNQFGVATKANKSFNKLKSLSLGGYYQDEDDYYQFKENGVLLQQLSLVAFPSLKALALYKNNINKTMLNQNLHVLSNLEELFLSDSPLDNNFLQSIGVLTSLKSISLERCGLTSTLPPKGWCGLKNLKTLFLLQNNINKNMLNQNLHVLSNLEELFLYESPLDNNFLQSIGVFTSLKSISLERCGLTGTLPTKGWCDLKNLKELNLRENELSGILPSCLGNLTSLRLLDISQNQFIGNVALSPLTHLTLLQYLSISNNHFQVPNSFKSFANHSNLKFFLSDFNQLVSEHDHVQTRVSKFQPSIFSLSNCGAKEHPIKPPSFLYNQYNLKLVDLSFNEFGGTLPYWLFKNNTRLQVFLVNNNSFVGPFHLPSHPSLDVIGLDISNNQIESQIPSNISLIFPFVEKLLLSGNALGGKIPNWLGGMKFLQILDLSNNQFSSSILEHLAMGNSLYSLRLSNNNLSGKIPTTIFNSQSLRYLYLDGNNFEGEISQLSSSSFLEVLDINNNHLPGKLPRWIRNLTQLECLVLSNNYFEGSIPEEFCYNDVLEFLDLSKNNLSGSLPSCSNPLNITHLYLSKNRLNGLLRHSFYNISSLVILDLSQNNFAGGIPKWIGNFSRLSILLLKDNHFSGKIPIEVCELKQLSMIDLSHNHLSSYVPSCLSHLTLKPSKQVYFSEGYLSTIITFSELEDQSFKNLGKTTMMMEEVLDEAAILFSIRISYAKDEVEFTTKRCSYTYEGHILNNMSGIDLSCNKLTGLIPFEMGNLSEIHSLNLSHNNLTGPIPSTFSGLKQIESLDLSFNNLNGEIPSQLIELNSLEVFSFAHNNLSGTIPYGKAQFGTFEKSSCEGNPFLCGPPLDKSCEETNSQLEGPDSFDEEKECGSIDMDIFYISFMVTYVIVLLSIVAVLYINPYWRRAWFYLVERCVTNCYYFIMDNLSRF
ncbi:hypothetical protein SLA2020_248420 [Shorea laevis]